MRQDLIYAAQVLDAVLYIFLPQLAVLLFLSSCFASASVFPLLRWVGPQNLIMLLHPFLPTRIRLLQRRPLLHRMTGRTVVIGDIPWVAGKG